MLIAADPSAERLNSGSGVEWGVSVRAIERPKLSREFRLTRAEGGFNASNVPAGLAAVNKWPGRNAGRIEKDPQIANEAIQGSKDYCTGDRFQMASSFAIDDFGL